MGHTYAMDGECIKCGKYTDFFCDGCSSFICDNCRIKKQISGNEKLYFCPSCAKKDVKNKFHIKGEQLRKEGC